MVKTALAGKHRPSDSKYAYNFAPRVLADMARFARTSPQSIGESIGRLLAAGALQIEEDGPPSKRQRYLAVSDQIAARDAAASFAGAFTLRQ